MEADGLSGGAGSAGRLTSGKVSTRRRRPDDANLMTAETSSALAVELQRTVGNSAVSRVLYGSGSSTQELLRARVPAARLSGPRNRLIQSMSMRAAQIGSVQRQKAGGVDAKTLEKKFPVKVEKGNKDWSESDLAELDWALSRLSKAETAVLKGYRFLRWDTPEGRKKVDPKAPTRGGECGFHEVDVAKGTFIISMFDDCFGGAYFTAAELAKIEAGASAKTLKGAPAGGVEMLHELGHAFQVAEWMKAWREADAANKAYNEAVDAYNQADVKTQQKMQKKVDALEAAEQAKKKALDVAKDRVLNEFMKFRKDKEPLTAHGDTSPEEQFAEAFKLFKWNPTELKSTDPELFKWFQAGKFLPAAKTPAKTAAKKKPAKKSAK